MNEKDGVCDVINDLIQTSHMNICLCMDQYGTTPLIYAAYNGHLPVVEYLVEKGADLEAKDKVSDVISSM